MPRYAVFRLDFDDVRQERLGELDLDDANMLHIGSAAPDAQPALDEAVADLNGRHELIVKLPPEGGDKDSANALNKVAVDRTSPDFLDAIQDNLRRWHNMELDA